MGSCFLVACRVMRAAGFVMVSGVAVASSRGMRPDGLGVADNRRRFKVGIAFKVVFGNFRAHRIEIMAFANLFVMLDKILAAAKDGVGIRNICLAIATLIHNGQNVIRCVIALFAVAADKLRTKPPYISPNCVVLFDSAKQGNGACDW